MPREVTSLTMKAGFYRGKSGSLWTYLAECCHININCRTGIRDSFDIEVSLIDLAKFYLTTS